MILDNEQRSIRNSILFEKLKPLQKSVAALIAIGRTYADIEKEIGVTYNTIKNYEAKPGFKEYVQMLTDIRSASIVKVHAEAKEEFNRCVMKAINTLETIMDNSKSDVARANCAIKIIDYAGLKPTEKHEISGNYVESLVVIDPDIDDADNDDDADVLPDVDVNDDEDVIMQAHKAMMDLGDR